MRIFFYTLGLNLVFASFTYACIGGNLIQLLIEDESGNKVVVATYNFINGEQVALNKKFKVLEVREITAEAQLSSRNICLDSSCHKLAEVNNQDLQFVVGTADGSPYGNGKSKWRKLNLSLENISIGGNAPRTRGIQNKPPEVDTLLRISGCARKNSIERKDEEAADDEE